MTNQPIRPFGRLRRPAGLIGWSRSYTTPGDTTQSSGKPLRIFYAFDPRRAAILLIGGDKTGDKRFYDRMIAIADDLYDAHLVELDTEKNHGR
jgi:hypothetical protein